MTRVEICISRTCWMDGWVLDTWRLCVLFFGGAGLFGVAVAVLGLRAQLLSCAVMLAERLERDRSLRTS